MTLQPLPFEPVELADMEIVGPDERCLASTASPVDRWRRCPVHADGAHHCYQGPGHQHAKRDSLVTEEPHVDDQWQAPDWATHVCDCDFAWADVVQTRRKAIR